MIGLGIGISNAAEFNRRAFIALRNVTIVNRKRHQQLEAIKAKAIEGRMIDDEDQKFVYQVVHDYRSQINDKLVIDFAVGKVQGYSS
jgi:hypothetical protein